MSWLVLGARLIVAAAGRGSTVPSGNEASNVEGSRRLAYGGRRAPFLSNLQHMVHRRPACSPGRSLYLSQLWALPTPRRLPSTRHATPETARARHGMSQASQSNRFGGNLLGHCMCMTRCDAVFGIAAAAVAAGPRTCMPTRRTLYPCATRASSRHPSREKGGRVEGAFCNMRANKAPPFRGHLEP